MQSDKIEFGSEQGIDQLLHFHTKSFQKKDSYTQLIQFMMRRYCINKDSYPKLSNISLAWYGFEKHEEIIIDSSGNSWTFNFIPVDATTVTSLDSIFSHLTGTSDELKETQLNDYLKQHRNNQD